jgi:hypothetical protein
VQACLIRCVIRYAARNRRVASLSLQPSLHREPHQPQCTTQPRKRRLLLSRRPVKGVMGKVPTMRWILI